MTTKSVLILGAGAIGAFYGSLLARLPQLRVSVVCRSNYKTVLSSGFRITSPLFKEPQTWHPRHVFPNPSAARLPGNQIWDYVLVSTKALPEISDDSKLLDGLVGAGTKILLIQNGLGVEVPYHERWSGLGASIQSAVTIASCSQPEPGHILHARWTRINVGAYRPPSTDPDQGREIVDWFREAGITDAKWESEADMQMLRWHKVAINAAMNPSSVLTDGGPNLDMATDPEMTKHLLGVMQEVLSTAEKVVGKKLPKSFATAEQIVKSTTKNDSKSVPSMQQDWAHGRRMELEVILGAPLRMAAEKGVVMPRLQTMYALIGMKQRRREDAMQANRPRGQSRL